MKFEEENIGGNEVEAIQYEFLGNDNDAATEMIGIAKAMMGEMKNRMRLGELSQLKADRRLPNISFFEDGEEHITTRYIVVESIKYSDDLPALDKATIYANTTAGEEEEGNKPVCLGYIIQAFVDLDMTTVTYEMELNTPSGKYLRNFDLDTDDIAFAGYPDNNAKYETAYYINNNKQGEEPELQEVFTKDITEGYRHEFLGAIAYEISGSFPKPSLPSGWESVSQDYTASGTCGTSSIGPITWGELGSYFPCSGTLTATNTGASVAISVEPGLGYTGGHHLTGSSIFDFQCERDGDPGDFLSDAGFIAAYTSYQFATSTDAIVTNIFNVSSQASYNEVSNNRAAYGFADSLVTSYLSYFTDFDNYPLYPIYKHKDNYGFACASGGFIIGRDDIQLTKPDMDNGIAFLFMMPSNDEQKYVYANELIDSFESTSITTGPYLFSTGAAHVSGSCIVSHNPFTRGDTDEYRNNIKRYVDEIYNIQERFGIPVKVDYGIHKTQCKVSNPARAKDGQVKIYLLIDSKSEYGTVLLTTTRDISDLQTINILVGEFDDMDNFGSLVSVTD